MDTNFHLIKAARDQFNIPWFEFGDADRSVWFSSSELETSPAAVFSRIATTGAIISRPASKNAFRCEVEAFDRFDPATVCRHPGWHGGAYAHGDGKVQHRREDDRTFILPFQPLSKFERSGTLAKWQDAVGPFVTDQPLPLFVLAYAISAALIGLAPPDFQNPIVEIVGETHCGKTVLGILAGSVWGGDPNSGIGFCESWDVTIGQLGPMQLQHRDSLLVLDEANLTGTNEVSRGATLREAIFKLTQTGQRKSLHVESSGLQHSRLCVLSTSNEPIQTLISSKSKSGAAALSRILTIVADRPFGIFDTVPAGFGSAQDSVEVLQRQALSNYGAAGPALVDGLMGFSAQKVRDAIEKGLECRFAKSLSSSVQDPRHGKILKLTYAAGLIARKLGILPAAWGSLEKALNVASRTAAISIQPTAINRIQAYIREAGDRFIDAEKLETPLSTEDFYLRPGFWLERGRLCLIPTERLKATMSDYHHVLKELRVQGRLRHEEKKLSQKAPKRSTVEGRAFFIDVGARA